MPSTARTLVLFLVLLRIGAVNAQPTPAPIKDDCPASQTLSNIQLKPSIAEALKRAFSAEYCSSIQRVLKTMARRGAKGGRELHPSEGLNRAEAERELRDAAANPEYVKALAAQQAGETVPVRLKLIEAALLDGFGYVAARELRVRELAAQIVE